MDFVRQIWILFKYLIIRFYLDFVFSDSITYAQRNVFYIRWDLYSLAEDNARPPYFPVCCTPAGYTSLCKGQAITPALSVDSGCTPGLVLRCYALPGVTGQALVKNQQF